MQKLEVGSYIGQGGLQLCESLGYFGCLALVLTLNSGDKIVLELFMKLGLCLVD